VPAVLPVHAQPAQQFCNTAVICWPFAPAKLRDQLSFQGPV